MSFDSPTGSNSGVNTNGYRYPQDQLLDEELLYNLYIEERMSISKIHNTIDEPFELVRQSLHRSSLDVRKQYDHENNEDTPWRDRDLMSRLYVDQEYRMGEIAKRFNCSTATIHRWIQRHEIEVREGGPKRRQKNIPDRSYLYDLYIEKGLSAREIGKKHGVRHKKVIWWLEQCGIQTRSRMESLGSSSVVEETGHHVKSSWEREIDIMLYESGVDYEYEKKYTMPGKIYHPDFKVGLNIIEIKGRVYQRDIDRSQEFMEYYPNLTYIGIGGKIPCDTHLKWEERDKLLEVINE